jgi:hypothetical protein
MIEIPKFELNNDEPKIVDYSSMHVNSVIDLYKKPERPPLAISIGLDDKEYKGVRYPLRFGTFGNISMIKGEEKARKSWLKSLILACAMGGNSYNYSDIIKGHNLNDKFIIDIDTEQDVYDNWMSANRLPQMFGTIDKPILPENYIPINLREYSANDIKGYLEWLFMQSEYRNKLGVVSIDGYVDCVNDFKNQITPYQQAQLGMEREKFEFEKTKSAIKPLPEGLNKQVTGSINLSDAITDYQSKIKGFGVKDFANPDKRAEMGNAYNNMMLQAKEAYNLGVLNGPDYDILQRVVRDPTNPSSLLFSNKALDKQAETLRTTAKNIVNTAYISQGRDVPADVARKLVKPEVNKPLQSFNTEQDVQQAIQTGTLKKGDKVTVNGVTGTIQ